MLEKLYQMKMLDYEKLLRHCYRDLKLDEKNLFILLAILDEFNGQISVLELAQKYKFEKSEIENCLANLLELDYIEIYMNILPDGKQTEAYRLSPLFKRLELLLNAKNETEESDLTKVIERLEKASKRVLTPSELNNIVSWFEEGFSFFKISSEMDKLGLRLSVKNLEQALYNNPLKKEVKKPSGNLKKAFEMVGNR